MNIQETIILMHRTTDKTNIRIMILHKKAHA